MELRQNLTDHQCETVGEITIDIYYTFSELSKIKKDWDDFINRSGSDIYFTFDWLQTWWKYYSYNRRLACMFVRSGVRPLAALPFSIGKLSFGPFYITVARFVGSDSTISVFTPAVERGLENDVWTAVLHLLFSKESVDAVSLSPLSGSASMGDIAKEIVSRNAGWGIVRDDSAGPHTSFVLPETATQYLAMLSSKTRSNNRRYLRKLSDETSISSRVLLGGEVAERFDDFVKLHQLQWEAVGKQGHFCDWPSSLSFNRELVSKLSASGRVRLHEILGDDKLLASQFSFVLGDRSYWRLPARRVDGIEANPGLGRLALVKMIEDLIQEGIHLIEAGPGHYDYKIEHGGKEFPLRRLVFARSSFVISSKAKLFLAWSDLINFLYYRMWFLKAAPLVRRRRRPLWHSWIITRL